MTNGPPRGVRTVPVDPAGDLTTVVLVRHGEAECNVAGVVGGPMGCTGLSAKGRAQAADLADRLARTGELGAVAALYASVLPRAIQTAEILAPALDRWRSGPSLAVVADCDLCELHPGEADGLTWDAFSARFPEPDWDADPSVPLAPAAESWLSFVERASSAVGRIAERHRGQAVVVVCHAGVIEATMLRFLPLAPGTPRLGLRTDHASMTVWERAEATWRLRRYNVTD